MGYWKQILMEQSEKGYRYDDSKYVCVDCITSEFIRVDIEKYSTDAPCSYCGKSPAAPISVVCDALSSAFHWSHTDPANVLMYDSAEGGYIGEVSDGYDMVMDTEEFTENTRLMCDVAGQFADYQWTVKDPWGLSTIERLRLSWRGFCELIKHKTRYFFLQSHRDDDSELTSAADMLDELGQHIVTLDLVSTMRKNADIIRARIGDKGCEYRTVAELGPPPRTIALSPSRMSPPGIPMFYGALEEETAIQEVASHSSGNVDLEKSVSIGYFRLNRDIRVVDFTSLPNAPSVYDVARRHNRDVIEFIHKFVRDIMRPVNSGKSAEHYLDYVPSQVVTEYFRYGLRSRFDLAIDGLIYPSAVVSAGHCMVLFVEAENCGPRDGKDRRDVEEILSLVRVESRDLGAPSGAG
ncbi:MAG: HEPN-associated N-terminal domain-containing protein [Chloroflexota bacterium]